MRRKMYATAMTAMLVTGTLMGLAVPAAERDGVTLHGDSTYDSIEKITDEDLTLKIMLAIRDGDTIKAPEELAAVQDLEALTGVNIEWEVIKASDWSMKTNLMFASGEMPDIIIAVNGQGQIDYEEYGVSQELVIPLDDYITEELMPNYYSRIQAEESDPTISLVASDGKTYSIGYLVGQYICEEGHYFINRDWMNELGLEDPTTIEELTEVLRKFKEAYPDYVPYEMGLDDGVAANSECILPPSVDGKGAYMDRYLELARPCAFITATNEHVEESIRLLDAMMDTEMQADLYYGPQNPTEGTGWVYDEENGKINTVTVSDVTVKNQIDCNTQFFAPGDYISENYNLSEQRLEKIDYCQMYDEAGVINTYSSQYFAMSGLTADVLADFSLIETDIDNAVSEAVADFVAHGVTDDSWDSFVSKFDGMNIDQYVSTYQEAIDGMDLE